MQLYGTVSYLDNVVPAGSRGAEVWGPEETRQAAVAAGVDRLGGGSGHYRSYAGLVRAGLADACADPRERCP